MILETTRTVCDALQNPVYGVNAQLANVVTDVGDPLPTAVASITDDTRDFLAAQGRFPDVRPAITVMLGQKEIDLASLNKQTDADVTLIIRYAMNESDTEQGLRDTYHTLYAVEKALLALDTDANEADRKRNGIHLLQMKSLEQLAAEKYASDNVLTSAIRVTYWVRDINN